MYPTFGGRSAPDRGVIAGYVDEIRGRSPAKWGMQIAGMSFQTRSSTPSSQRSEFCFVRSLTGWSANTLISIDAYHYFTGYQGSFQEKILPFIKDNGVVLIGIPGLKDEYTGRAEELLSEWLSDDAYMFKSQSQWKELIGSHDRIESVKTWEMDCFGEAWNDWLAADNEFARGDRQYFETIIRPYTCFVGIYIKLR